MPEHFARNGWDVTVLSCEIFYRPTWTERWLNRLPHRVITSPTIGHPRFSSKVSNLDPNKWILCSTDNLEAVLEQFPQAENVIHYQLGRSRKGTLRNYFTALDVVFNSNGITPIIIHYTNVQTGRNTILLWGNTTTDSVSIHRNFKQAGFFAEVLLKKLANQLPSFDKTPDLFAVPAIKVNELGLIFKVIGKFTVWALKKATGRDGKTRWECTLTQVPDSLDENMELKALNWKSFSPYDNNNGQCADPFIWKKDGQTALFYEYIPVGSKKGEIHVSILNSSGGVLQSKPILEKDYHLAYPHIFMVNDQLYMIPDSGNNYTVDLYECVKFPFEWKYVKTLMSGKKRVDCTLIEKDKIWWLFCNESDNEFVSSFDHLCIYSTNNPITGDWKPHALNPVISDASVARSAGRIFGDNKGWIRPSQNSAFTYGHGLNLNRIVELSEEIYKEETIRTYTPWEKNMGGIHTLNFNHDWIVIDQKRNI